MAAMSYAHSNLGESSVITHSNRLSLLSQRVFFMLNRACERGSGLLGLHEEEEMVKFMKQPVDFTTRRTMAVSEMCQKSSSTKNVFTVNTTE